MANLTQPVRRGDAPVRGSPGGRVAVSVRSCHAVLWPTAAGFVPTAGVGISISWPGRTKYEIGRWRARARNMLSVPGGEGQDVPHFHRRGRRVGTRRRRRPRPGPVADRRLVRPAPRNYAHGVGLTSSWPPHSAARVTPDHVPAGAGDLLGDRAALRAADDVDCGQLQRARAGDLVAEQRFEGWGTDYPTCIRKVQHVAHTRVAAPLRRVEVRPARST